MWNIIPHSKKYKDMKSCKQEMQNQNHIGQRMNLIKFEEKEEICKLLKNLAYHLPQKPLIDIA